MKQQSVRLFAPFHSASLFLARLVHFSARKAAALSTLPQFVVGKWRLYLNYCPECNSCAPRLHQCDVCKADTKAYFSWNREIEKAWWKRYANKHHIPT